MKRHINQQRRKFCKQVSILAGGSTILAQHSNLGLINNAMALTSPYADLTDQKSLVCIILSGGNDAFNMFVPYETDSYQHYASIRNNLAIPKNTLHPVSGEQHAFHPSMPDVRDLYDQNKLALLSNVGNLIQPVTREELLAYNNGENNGIQIPPVLFSHSHQAEIAQTNRAPQAGISHPGWGGLMSDLLRHANTDPNISPSFSLVGNNLWQSGAQTQPFSIASSGVKSFQIPYIEPLGRRNSMIDSWHEILNLNHPHILQRHVADLTNNTEQRINALSSALAQSENSIQTPYNIKNDLASQLRMIARLIYARNTTGGLGMNRQIFLARLGAFDTHGNQLIPHANLLAILNEALDSFYKTTVELDLADSVTTFTNTEFGRSMTVNGDGTDHGWGGHNLIMGGAVGGGKVYGDLPDLSPGGVDDAGDSGRMIPKISNDQYGATLAKWMGINESDLFRIFPNLSNFSNHNLGFLGGE